MLLADHRPSALRGARWATLLAAFCAVALPTLVPLKIPPAPTALIQALAVAFWGLLLAIAAPRGAGRGALWLAPAWGLLGLGVLASWPFGALPSSVALDALALLAAAGLVAWAGAALAESGRGAAIFEAVAWAVVVAGVLNTAVGAVQVYFPERTGSFWLAVPGNPGIAYGNIRQPNQLAVLLNWGIACTAWLHQRGRLARNPAWALLAVLALGVELSGSRAGMVELAVLAAWGALDRRLKPTVRLGLVACLAVYGAAFATAYLLPPTGAGAAGAAARLEHNEFVNDSPNSRRNLWRNVGALVAQQPWAGVGYGELNLAISMTPDAHRPSAFFDHAHNLPLQLAAELGIPLAALICAGLLAAVWAALRRARAADDEEALTAAGAMALLAVMAVASMVEYPLWYAYFLLPTAFVWGLALGRPGTAKETEPRRGRLVGVLLLVGGAAAAMDYMRVESIYRPMRPGATIEQHVASGLHSVFYSNMAGYAVATLNVETDKRRAMDLAVHALLDWQLMESLSAWLAAHGQVDKARFVAARLREFKRPETEAFFAVCATPQAAQAYQCQRPERSYSWRDFQRPGTVP